MSGSLTITITEPSGRIHWHLTGERVEMSRFTFNAIAQMLPPEGWTFEPIGHNGSRVIVRCHSNGETDGDSPRP